ncbi:hypothetical protein PoB_000626700 [Plakobranchus ocellatus]|uniref:Uncharacterized protein n=1 Tax=Plakobranchus ocellatus TaxID=259542 RepID=A0AAV3YCD2_9GAST|nr:hypothetical protein PoB_000626700 [Plakobranchus ocellatus]
MSLHLESGTVSGAWSNLKKFVIFSDDCTYQILSNNFLAPHHDWTIQQIYLVCGHTHMELDNSYSLIQRTFKGLTTNAPYDHVGVLNQSEIDYLGSCYIIRLGKEVSDSTLSHIYCFKRYREQR